MNMAASSAPHDWIITHHHKHLDFVSGMQYLICNHSQRSYKIYLAPNNVELPEFPGDSIFLRTEPSHVKTIYLSIASRLRYPFNGFNTSNLKTIRSLLFSN
jgi:hypothetical protein